MKSSPGVSPFSTPKGEDGWLARGIKHPKTPILEQSYAARSYTDKGGQTYLRPDTEGPRVPSFLPSEMRRVNTPPLIKPKHGKAAGFFFELSKPFESNPNTPDTELKTYMSRRQSITSIRKKTSATNIFRRTRSSTNTASPPSETVSPKQEQPPPHPTIPNVFRQRFDNAGDEDEDDEDLISEFALDVPDHLPSSPLCPLHPKHKGGPKPICPLHGRGKGMAGKRLTDEFRAALK